MYKKNDHYARKAKKENYVARSVYKLKEIDEKYKVLHSGDQVLDLGASPGSWSQYASEKIGDKGKLLGIDLKKVFLSLPNAVFMKGDILTLDMGPALEEHGFIHPFDVVISDMAPDTTSSRFTDQMKSLELCEMALEAVKKVLRPGGHFVCKIFDSGDAMGFRDELKNHFKTVQLLRPKSTQQASKEFFMIGKHRK
ncbi:MAG: RlmE family RNA methyltransferase [Bacteroidia bacterium]|nr:RlmE family RNA methyltransferase [Bacteroidota bacterium]MBP9083621.1 RlmE family RNA methyltransferase [Bacteroidia bacterium]MBK7968174.1 RlmE family RNA methyltransferase [Bacteroidota bacterium]MBK8416036.1 RlmE family RNA methyltransferase [Bacteroidota bacterium]MBK8873209.1 RlmE family RNA methyltransferase [Bacteroidota bacterium]